MKNITINTNKKLNGIEIAFASKPDREYLDLLKSNGFRWHRQKKLWYAKENSKTRSVVEQIKDNDDLMAFKGFKEVEGYLGSPGFKGINNDLGLSRKDRNALIKKEFKKRFPMFKVSIRQGKGGYLDSVNVELTVSRSRDVIDLNSFKSNFSNLDTFFQFGELGYGSNIDDNVKDYNKDHNKYISNRYELLKKYEKECVLSDASHDAMKWLKDAFCSFNHDESNGMVDYFDRDIYDFYSFNWVD